MNASTRPLSLSSFDEAMRFLYRLRSFGTKLGLENVRFLLDKLGSPDSHGDYLHIAGTNGKGSTAAFLSSILREAGLKVGLFTSPHLLVFNERIQINGVPISDQAVLEHLNAILPVAARMEADGVHRYPTFFEVVTAIATLHFAAAGVDAVVWETGMGGRLDATNAVRTRASVITSVSLDHTAWLGGTIEKVAAEKAGIIRPATPVFTSVIDAQALKVILQTVVERQAPAVCIAPESEAGMFHAVVSEACGYYAYMIRYVPYEARRARSGTYSLSIQPLGLDALPLSLAGKHQVQNAALAAAVGQWYLSSRRLLASLTESDLGEPMPETTSGLHGFSVDGPKYQSASVNPRSAIRKGLASAVWPGRFQVLRQKPLVVLDCAHNADAALKLLELLKESSRKRWTLVFGVLADKDWQAIVKILGEVADEIWYLAPSAGRALPYGDFTRDAAKLGICTPVARTCSTAADVVAKLKSPRLTGGPYIIAGSCYLAGDILSAWAGAARDSRADDPVNRPR